MERKIIYKENSEEYKAIKLLEQKTKNNSLNGENLHYALILYNLIVNLSIENKQLKDELKSNPDTQITLQDNKGNKFMVIQTERIDMQEELNKTIQRLFDNWNKLKEHIKSEWTCFDNESVEVEVSIDILDKMQELEEK